MNPIPISLRQRFHSLPTVLLALVTLPTSAVTPAHPTGESWTYKEGRGITLSQTAAKALGIETVEVTAATIIPERASVPLQVYQSAAGSPRRTALASFYLPAGEASKLTIGQPLEVRKGADTYLAKTTAITKSPGHAGGMVEVLAAVDDPKGTLAVGDFLEAHLSEIRGKRSNVPAIPATAFVDSVKGPFVYIANGNSYLRTPIRIGAQQNGVVEVLDGLFEGDVIVAHGSSGLWMVELQAVNAGKGCADCH